MKWSAQRSADGMIMNKQEFIDRLRAALNGNVSPGLVQENVNYYEDYINTEIRKGKAEEEVLQSLGEPRLIARTIIETNGKSDGVEYRETGYQSSGYQGNARENGYQDNTNIKPRGVRIPGWAWVIIIILIIGLIISMVFSVLSFLAPIILPIIVVVFLVKLFRDWLN